MAFLATVKGIVPDVLEHLGGGFFVSGIYFLPACSHLGYFPVQPFCARLFFAAVFGGDRPNPAATDPDFDRLAISRQNTDDNIHPAFFMGVDIKRIRHKLGETSSNLFWDIRMDLPHLLRNIREK